MFVQPGVSGANFLNIGINETRVMGNEVDVIGIAWN
jgi:hypothetical protein